MLNYFFTLSSHFTENAVCQMRRPMMGQLKSAMDKYLFPFDLQCLLEKGLFFLQGRPEFNTAVQQPQHWSQYQYTCAYSK
jgi:hypothetical protein